MPELPEVETTLRGIAPYVQEKRIERIIVRQPQLRWPVPKNIKQAIGQIVINIRRRAKYLLLDTDSGSIVFHLGMSGSLTIQSASKPVLKHDHLDIVFEDQQCLRLNDPRRFGACLWQGVNDPTLTVLENLGPEPLSSVFNGEWLHKLSRGRSIAVKNFIMTNAVVVGVGNIYANESLYRSGINPHRAAGKISLQRYQLLSEQIKDVLTEAIQQGGTTLRDFYGADGKPGYFRIQLKVYGKAGDPCEQCGTAIRSIRIGQRNTFYCARCQR